MLPYNILNHEIKSRLNLEAISKQRHRNITLGMVFQYRCQTNNFFIKLIVNKKHDSYNAFYHSMGNLFVKAPSFKIGYPAGPYIYPVFWNDIQKA